jgi:hypothetical protein
MANHREATKTLLVEQISQTIRDRLSANSALNVSAPMRSAGGINPAIAEGIKLYEAGRAHYVSQHYGDAATSFTQALFHFEKNPAGIRDWKLIETLLFRLAAARFQANDPSGADDALSRLFAFNPEFALPAEDLPDAFKARFATQTAAYKKLAPGKLDTSGVDPTGAEVWINGKVRSVTPVEVANLNPGNHFIVLRKDGASMGMMLRVEPQKTLSLQTTLTPAASQNQSPEAPLLDALRPGTVNDAVRQQLTDLADLAAVRFVATGLVFQSGNELRVAPLLFDRHDSTLRALKHTSFDRDLLNLNVNAYQTARDLGAAIRDPATGTLIAPTDSLDLTAITVAVAPPTTSTTTPTTPPPTTTPPKDPPKSKPLTFTSDPLADDPDAFSHDTSTSDAWYASPWLWTGVGIGVAAIVITTLALTLGDDDATTQPGFNARISW